MSEQSDSDAPPASATIPWQRRKTTGQVVAFLATIGYVLRRLGRFRPEEVTTFSLRDARRFRHAVVWVAWLAGVATFFITWAAAMNSGSDAFGYRWPPAWNGLEDIGVRKGGYWTLLGLTGAATLIGLYGATGAIGWFFTSRRLSDVGQDRALGAACYATAPLGLLFIEPLIGLALLGLSDTTSVLTGYRFVANSLLGLAAIWCCAIAVCGVYTVMGRGVGRTTATAVLLPIIWVGIAALVIAVPWALLTWRLMIASLA